MNGAALRGEFGGRLALLLFLCRAAMGCEPRTTGEDGDESGDENGRGGAAPSNGACGATPGEYLATFTPVSDDCGGVLALPSEPFNITTQGEVLAANGNPPGDGSAPSGCVDDDGSRRGCVVSFTRECASEVLLLVSVGTADVRGAYSLDFGSGTGSVDIAIAVFDGPTLLQSCQAAQNIRITAL
jgi:hypothetical protein